MQHFLNTVKKLVLDNFKSVNVGITDASYVVQLTLYKDVAGELAKNPILIRDVFAYDVNIEFHSKPWKVEVKVGDRILTQGGWTQGDLNFSLKYNSKSKEKTFFDRFLKEVLTRVDDQNKENSDKMLDLVGSGKLVTKSPMEVILDHREKQAKEEEESSEMDGGVTLMNFTKR